MKTVFLVMVCDLWSCVFVSFIPRREAAETAKKTKNLLRILPEFAMCSRSCTFDVLQYSSGRLSQDCSARACCSEKVRTCLRQNEIRRTFKVQKKSTIFSTSRSRKIRKELVLGGSTSFQRLQHATASGFRRWNFQLHFQPTVSSDSSVDALTDAFLHQKNPLGLLIKSKKTHLPHLKAKKSYERSIGSFTFF